LNKRWRDKMTDALEFISKIENKNKQSDAIELLTIMERESGYQPYLIGNVIRFGKYHYKYESGREGDSSVTAFSPRKQNLVVYIMPGFSTYQDLLGVLGKFKLGKSCLYFNKLNDIDVNVLRKIIRFSVKDMQKKYDCKKE